MIYKIDRVYSAKKAFLSLHLLNSSGRARNSILDCHPARPLQQTVEPLGNVRSAVDEGAKACPIEPSTERDVIEVGESHSLTRYERIQVSNSTP